MRINSIAFYSFNTRVFRIYLLTLPIIFGKIKTTETEKFVPISGKDLRKLFYDAGYELVPGSGKGSHWKLKKKGCATVTIPNHKELKKGTEHALRKLLEENK